MACCLRFSNGCDNCYDRLEDWFCGSSPFNEDTNAGDVATIVKVSILGLLLIAACAVCCYYANMASFDGLSIAGICMFGIYVVINTVLRVAKPIMRLHERSH